MPGSMDWRTVGVAVLCVVCVAAPTVAQNAPRAEFSGGYQFLWAKPSASSFGDDEWARFRTGWYVDGAANVTDMLGVVGQVATKA